MKNFIKNFVRDESGASAAEYALILAIVGVGIATAAVGLRTQIVAAFTGATTALTTANAGG